MVIGLFGFTFAHENMGCQALTCSFLEMLRQLCPDEHIEIIGLRDENTLGEIPKLFPEMEFKLMRISYKKNPFWKQIKKCDIVFDETFGDGFSDIYFTKSAYRDALTKWIAAHQKTPFVMTPQTYGPFKHKTLEKLAAKAIRCSTAVYARDGISADYAARISRREVKTVTDLAFSLPFKKSLPDSDKFRLGFNVSGLLWNGGFSSENQFGLKTDYREYCCQIIEWAISQGMEVHIIPHVTVSGDANRVVPDGDYPACEFLKEKYPQVSLAPCFTTPYDVKNYIASMDCFIGARMHATIGAFSSGVATIPFAYSRKFKGLYDNFNYPYYVDGTVMDTKSAFDKTIEYIGTSDKLKANIEVSMKEVNVLLDKFREELLDLLIKARG